MQIQLVRFQQCALSFDPPLNGILHNHKARSDTELPQWRARRKSTVETRSNFNLPVMTSLNNSAQRIQSSPVLLRAKCATFSSIVALTFGLYQLWFHKTNTSLIVVIIIFVGPVRMAANGRSRMSMLFRAHSIRNIYLPTVMHYVVLSSSVLSNQNNSR